MITADTKIMDVVSEIPESVLVFQQYGLGCIGCMLANFETLGEGATAHGIDVESLVNDINNLASAQDSEEVVDETVEETE